ncbi:MAG: hypothetical protein CME61_02720 [Halobacteriovoraceae bacterium]|nr:hypothetical protein [Halobacteriovoraceae bacterium]|tara:strand:+ start:392 stop:655 length:264 start_codon:yes stop_codon:yes gene_type:complete
MAFNVSPLYAHLRKILYAPPKSSFNTNKGAATAMISSDSMGANNPYMRGGLSEYDKKHNHSNDEKNKRKQGSEEEKTKTRLKLLDLI